MKRIVVLIAAGFVCAGTGCDKSPDHGRKAELASANGLMPGPAPTYEEIYVVDQAQVKSAPKRTVSYEPLESFGSGGGKSKAPAETKESEEPKTKKADAKTPAAKTSKTAAPKSAAPPKSLPAPGKSPARPPSGGSGGFWTNVGAKALMGGGAPAGGGPAAKPAPPQSGKEKPKAAKSEEEADDEKSADDEEKETDDEEKDSDEEGDDSGKDDKKDNDGG